MVVVVALRERRTIRREQTLAGQFLVLQLAVVALLLLIVGVVGVRQSTSTFTTERGSQMRSVAEYVANLPQVRAILTARATGAPEFGAAETLAPYAIRGVSLSSATEVLIVEPDRRVLASSDPAEVGRMLDLGASVVLRGRGWSGDAERHGERAVAAHAPILADDGTLVGFVVSEAVYPSVWSRFTGAASDLALYLGLGAGLGVVGSLAVSVVVRRRTRGLGARELASLADQRAALLHSIREGVVGVGVDGRVTVMNDAARQTLGVQGQVVGRAVAELGLEDQVAEVLTGAGDVQDDVMLVGDRVVVLNRRAAAADGRGIGTVTTLRDRTELVALESRLGANLSLTDTLRAQTHEFDNRLHTISGLVQLGEFEEVRELVGTLTRHRAEVAAAVARQLEDPAVAAMVVAKMSVAAERGVDLVLDPGSQLPPLAREVSADLTTVVGNLVDNAVDACAGTAGAAVEIWMVVDASTGVDAVQLRVRDTGPGVAPEDREVIFVRGFTTKARRDAAEDVAGGRGIGLPLVRVICRRRGGSIVVDDVQTSTGTEPGAEFRVVLPIGPGLRQGEVS